MKFMTVSPKKYFPFTSAAGWRRLFTFVLVCLIIPLLLIGLYARPYADDCDYGIETHAVVQSGGGLVPLIGAALHTAARFYNNWQGTYASCFVMSLQPGIFGDRLYFLTPLLLIGGIFLCLFIVFHIVTKRFLSGRPSFRFLLSLLCTAVVLCGLPSAAEGLYWFNGAMHYMPWGLTTIVSIALLCELYYTCSALKKSILLVISVLLSFVISGGNQSTALAHILLLSIGTALLILRKRYYSIAPLIAALTGFAIMAVAPGNAIRQDELYRADIISTIIQSAAQSLTYLGKWLNLSFLCILILFTPFAIAVVKNSAGKVQYRHPVWLMILSYGILCSMLCPPYYAMSDFGAARLTNTVWLIFLALALFNYVYLLGWLDCKTKILHKENFQLETVKPCNLALVGLLCLAMIFLRSPSNVNTVSNSAAAVMGLANGTAAAYAVERDAQLAILNDDSIRDAELSPIRVKADLLFLSDLNESPNAWPNTSCAEYYGKDSVRLVP